MVKKEEFLRENGFEKEGQEEVSRSDFPSDFVFGVATSAYQVCVNADSHCLDLLVFFTLFVAANLISFIIS